MAAVTPPSAPNRTRSTDTTLSFAMKPLSREVTIRQSPRPMGMKSGTDQAGNGGQDAVVGVGDHVEVEIKALQEPHDDGCDQDHAEGPCEEVPGFFPEKLPDVFQAGHPVVGQLHDKGDSLAPEDGLLKKGRHQDGPQ